VGTALVVGEWRTVLAFLIAGIGFTVKARHEEALLRSEFKDSYPGYAQGTGFLIPRFRSAK
jgi:protein-S-isoprenylcysteine O-methyltransferase Ste14